MLRSERILKVVSEAPESVKNTLSANELLSLDLIRNAAKTPPKAICGVYFLFRGLTLTYIGKSVNAVPRLLNHVRERDFDSYSIIECSEGQLADLETAYILLFKPIENRGIVAEGHTEGMRFWSRTAAEWRAVYKALKP